MSLVPNPYTLNIPLDCYVDLLISGHGAKDNLDKVTLFEHTIGDSANHTVFAQNN